MAGAGVAAGLRRAAPFLLPALVVLGALVVYPILFTVARSLFDRSGDEFVGLRNYGDMFANERTRTAIRNNVIWVVCAPALATALGLVFAVLAERVRWQTAFKVAVFMPMAISFLAAGVIFRLVYEADPQRGLANAALTTVGDVFRPPGRYQRARPADEAVLQPAPGGRPGFESPVAHAPGDEVLLGLLAIRPGDVPERAAPAAPAPVAADGLAGAVWLDFSRGGGGERGVVDARESGLPGIRVDVLDAAGDVVASARTADDGSWSVAGLAPGEYRVRLGGDAFRASWNGVNWLGPTLVTGSVILAFVWIWAGFAMIVIGAGLAAIPRELLEAARVDGANEWRVFRHVTVPLLMPVLLVVLVTLVINVLKIFDLVFIIPPASVQDDANVVALEMWRVSFGGGRDEGLGSALAVLLFVLVLPAMAFNIKRFRSGGDR